MKQIDRLIEYFLTKGFKSHHSIERKIGFGSGYISKQKQRGGELSQKSIASIVKACPDLNINWLLTGQGDMLHSKDWNDKYAAEIGANDPSVPYGPNWKEKYLQLLEKHNELLEKYTELLESSAGYQKTGTDN